MDVVMETLSSLWTSFPGIIDLLKSNYSWSQENLNFFMAVSAVMAVRAADDKLRQSQSKGNPWMYNLTHATLIGFGGGAFAPLLLARPSGLLAGGDFVALSSFVAYWLVFHSPFDVGYSVFSFLPLKIWTVLTSQLFKAGGICSYCNLGMGMFNATKYYPVPIMGPILTATLLGNVGPVFRLGWSKWFEKGMPANFENGLWLGGFYHLYVNDTTGFLGVTLRSLIKSVPMVSEFLDTFFSSDEEFARVFVGFYMVAYGVLKLPEFLGPDFNPFPASKVVVTVLNLNSRDGPVAKKSKTKSKQAATAPATKKKKSKKVD
ncbi:hypothetical protein TrST_g641 [Triparma strigata]|nr:hypothetical protein TrST_g641 [Triparma strigata]